MNTYNFLVTIGNTQFNIEINAITEDEAIDVIQKAYPIDEGYFYMLL